MRDFDRWPLALLSAMVGLLVVLALPAAAQQDGPLTLLTTVPVVGIADDVDLNYPFMYVATEDGLTVVDISTPSAPAVRGSVATPFVNMGVKVRGIFYSLLTATLAAETALEAFQVGRLDEAFLARYERRWHDRLGQELRVADWLRTIVTRCTDREIDALIDAMASDDVQALIRRTARFNWHRDLILAMLRQPGIKSLLVRALFR